jgi:3-isopropylmalate/(R)-2-methylmalate dehydratase small subunit
LPTVAGGSGPRFVREAGVVAPMLAPQVGDGIVPDALVDERHRGAVFLVASSDFDAGDVPENAVARLTTLGIRAVLAPGFERTFHGKCLTYGVLPVILDEAVAKTIFDRSEAGAPLEITVDLEQQKIDCPGMEAIAFDADPRVRNKLLLGLTDLEETLRYVGDIAALRTDDRNRRPWLYEQPGRGGAHAEEPSASREGDRSGRPGAGPRDTEA